MAQKVEICAGDNAQTPLGTPSGLRVLVNPGPSTFAGYQQISSLATAVALTVPNGALTALMIPETKTVRINLDATNPTSTVGMPLAAGQPLEITSDLANVRIIETAASASINVWYFA